MTSESAPRESAVPAAYFERVSDHRFRATRHVGGGWDPEEQHIAPVLGLVAHAIEADREARGQDRLRIGQISYDILGVLPIDVVELTVRVLRPGRTIELVEAELGHDGRTAVIARAWLMATYDTRGIAGTSFDPLPGLEDHPEWAASQDWPGGFIASLEARRNAPEAGRATAWMRTGLPLVLGESSTTTASVLGLVDAANGVSPRAPKESVAFPNLDLTAHLLREPRPGWIGMDTRVSFGPDGLGITHSVLHDDAGALGVVSQTLTVRPRT